MTLYQSRSQVQSELQRMLPHQIEECKECDELPPALERLIKYNFAAAFVCYDKKTGMIEVGVENQEKVSTYPEITVHKFKLDEIKAQLQKTFRNSDHDLKYYGKLLAGDGDRVDEVVLV